jgi:flavin reductase ActVB
MVMAVEAREIGAVFREIPTSVAVVSVEDADGAQYHVTVGSLCTVSQSPALVSFCVAGETLAHARLCGAARYSISVLAQGQGKVARHFAKSHSGPAEDEQGGFHGLLSAPHSLAWLLCVRDQLIEAGDHTMVLARVEAARRFDRDPLLYWRRDFRRLAPEFAPEAEGVPLGGRGPFRARRRSLAATGAALP